MKIIIYGLSIFLLTNCTPTVRKGSVKNFSPVQSVGAIKNVMMKGELYGTIKLDTLPDKRHLYGLGPKENLSGELLIMDGNSYQSTVLTDSTMSVSESFQVKAPFFVYANVDNWREEKIPDSVQNIQQFENFLDQFTQTLERPFAFKLNGTVEKANIHIVNLPEGNKVSSPQEAHIGRKNYHLAQEACDIIGFFSTEHESIFTHQGSYLHMHLITADKAKMGHLDDVLFKKGSMKFYLPDG